MADSGPRIEIEYCTKCRWMVRAAWMAQELLSTFEENLEGVALVPGAEGGIFEVRLAGGGVNNRMWSGARFLLPRVSGAVREAQPAVRGLFCYSVHMTG